MILTADITNASQHVKRKKQRVISSPDKQMLGLPQRGGAVQEGAGDGRRPVAGARAQLVLVAAAVDPEHTDTVVTNTM